MLILGKKLLVFNVEQPEMTFLTYALIWQTFAGKIINMICLRKIRSVIKQFEYFTEYHLPLKRAIYRLIEIFYQLFCLKQNILLPLLYTVTKSWFNYDAIKYICDK